jgi:hypothetical protein
LALVTASRQSLTRLNKATQQFSRTGSPYFNFLSEIPLGALPAKYVAELLHQAKDCLKPDDRRFIMAVAGAHPYLVQVAASALWEAHIEGEDDPIRRRQAAGQILHQEAELTLGDTWRLWSPATRRAFIAVALSDITMARQLFHEKRLLRDVHNFGPELRQLKKRGFVGEDATAVTGWRVRPQAFLWWIADELVRSVRDEPSLDEWLRKQEWEGLLTRGEREQLGKVIHTLVGMLKGGAAKLIEEVAEGFGEALGRRLFG